MRMRGGSPLIFLNGSTTLDARLAKIFGARLPGTLVLRFLFPDCEGLLKENEKMQFFTSVCCPKDHIRSPDGRLGEYKDV